MNERSKTSSAESGVLDKHDTLQTVQAPSPRILAESVRAGVHTMLQSPQHPSPAKKSRRRAFGAKKATITIAKRAPEDVSEVPAEGEERVSPGVQQELESGPGDS